MQVVRKVIDDRAADTSNLEGDLAFWEAVAKSEGLGGRTASALQQRWGILRKTMAGRVTLPRINRRKGKGKTNKGLQRIKKQERSKNNMQQFKGNKRPSPVCVDTPVEVL